MLNDVYQGCMQLPSISSQPCLVQLNCYIMKFEALKFILLALTSILVLNPHYATLLLDQKVEQHAGERDDKVVINPPVHTLSKRAEQCERNPRNSDEQVCNNGAGNEESSGALNSLI